MSSDEKPTMPKAIFDLVERFDRNREAHKSGNYNVKSTGVDFVYLAYFAVNKFRSKPHCV